MNGSSGARNVTCGSATARARFRGECARRVPRRAGTRAACGPRVAPASGALPRPAQRCAASGPRRTRVPIMTSLRRARAAQPDRAVARQQPVLGRQLVGLRSGPGSRPARAARSGRSSAGCPRACEMPTRPLTKSASRMARERARRRPPPIDRVRVLGKVGCRQRPALLELGQDVGDDVGVFAQRSDRRSTRPGASTSAGSAAAPRSGPCSGSCCRSRTGADQARTATARTSRGDSRRCARAAPGRGCARRAPRADRTGARPRRSTTVSTLSGAAGSERGGLQQMAVDQEAAAAARRRTSSIRRS